LKDVLHPLGIVDVDVRGIIRAGVALSLKRKLKISVSVECLVARYGVVSRHRIVKRGSGEFSPGVSVCDRRTKGVPRFQTA
jgi:hypothetical protein